MLILAPVAPKHKHSLPGQRSCSQPPVVPGRRVLSSELSCSCGVQDGWRPWWKGPTPGGRIRHTSVMRPIRPSLSTAYLCPPRRLPASVHPMAAGRDMGQTDHRVLTSSAGKGVGMRPLRTSYSTHQTRPQDGPPSPTLPILLHPPHRSTCSHLTHLCSPTYPATFIHLPTHNPPPPPPTAQPRPSYTCLKPFPPPVGIPTRGVMEHHPAGTWGLSGHFRLKSDPPSSNASRGDGAADGLEPPVGILTVSPVYHLPDTGYQPPIHHSTSHPPEYHYHREKYPLWWDYTMGRHFICACPPPVRLSLVICQTVVSS